MKLYPHQLEAINKLRNGCILNGGVGSGKSLTSLGYYYLKQSGDINFLKGGKYKKMKNPKDLYIITTAMKRDKMEWEKELSVFLLTKNKDVNIYDNKIIVDSWNNIKKYYNVKDSFFIFDEQRVVGYGAWVKAFLEIAKHNEWILLSATPGDKWEDYIPVFIANGFYKNKTEFKLEHIVLNPFIKYEKVLRYTNVGRLIRLRNKILINMDFQRSVVTHHENVYCDYDKIKYKYVTKNRKNIYKTININGKEMNPPLSNAAEMCYTLRRIVNEDCSRTNELLKIFDKYKKIIIFYNFDYELDILRNIFKSYINDDFDIGEWNGHQHQPIPNTNSWVYLVQYTAGSEGWNCIKTNVIVFYSQSYSYKATEQASGRINRLDTLYKDLYYYHLKSYSPIDLAISKALNDKKNFNEGKFIKW